MKTLFFLLLFSCGPGRIVEKQSPVIPPFALSVISPEYSNNPKIKIIANQCTQYEYLYFTESTNKPAADDPNWQSCSTSPLYYTFSTSVNETKKVQVWGKNTNFGQIGVYPLPALETILDTTPPLIQITSLPISNTKNGDSYTLQWMLTEMNTDGKSSQVIEFFDGLSWSTVGNVPVPRGPITNLRFQKTFVIKSSETLKAKWRITFTDIAKNTASVESSQFRIDNTSSVITFTNIPNFISPGQSYTFTWTLTESNAVKSNSFYAELYDGSTWRFLGNVAGADGALNATPFSLTITTPNVITNVAKLRLTYTNGANITTVAISTNFGIYSYLYQGTMSVDTLNVSTSKGSSVLVGGYDGDTITGGSGNDLLYPGDLPFTNTTVSDMTLWLNPALEESMMFGDISSLDSLNRIITLKDQSSNAFSFSNTNDNYPTLERNSSAAGRNVMSCLAEDRGLFVGPHTSYSDRVASNEAELIVVRNGLSTSNAETFGMFGSGTTYFALTSAWSSANLYVDFGNHTAGRVNGAVTTSLYSGYQAIDVVHKLDFSTNVYMSGSNILSGVSSDPMNTTETGYTFIAGTQTGFYDRSEFGDFMLFKRALSSADQQKVWSYLSQKYGIALAGYNLGVDTLTGGAGTDTFIITNSVYSGNTSGNRMTITDFSLAEGDTIYFQGTDEALYCVENNAFKGDGFGAVRFTQSGSDTLVQVDWGGDGTSDFEILLKGITASTLVNQGSITFQKSIGNYTADIIKGGFGNSYLVGMFGADTITGGAGDDIIIGDVPPLSAAQKSNLVAWYDALDPNADGTLMAHGNSMTTWKDLATGHNDLTAAGAASPTYSKNGSAIPSVSFDGAANCMQFSAQPILGTTARTIFLASNNVSSGTNDTTISLSNTGSNFGEFRIGPSGIIRTLAANYVPNSSTLSGATHVQAYENLAATTLAATSYWIDGVVQTYNAGASVNGSFNTLAANAYIGCFSPGTYHVQTYLYEVMLFGRALNSKEISFINQYMATRYASSYNSVTKGTDTLTGGAGADTFLFARGSYSGIGAGNRVIITDFSQSERDKIDLSDFPGPLTFRPNSKSGGDFTGAAREISWYLDSSNNRTIIYVDTDGDGSAEFEIELTGLINLQSTDFIL